jgi:RNA polymerase sigma factor (sigma-70 family)
VTESFLRLMRGIGKFRGESYAELDRFVRTNAVFACLQRLRDLPGREQTGDLEELAPVRSPGRFESVTECEVLLRRAVHQLPAGLLRVVSLNLQGYDCQEVAVRLGVSKQSVYQQKHEALGLLRDRLRQEQFWEHCAPYISELRFAPVGGVS